MRKLLWPIVLVSLAAPAAAQKGEIDVDRGPTSELYMRKRPPIPAAPTLSEELKKLLASTEKARDDKRLEAIKGLREFLASKPMGETKAEGQFKLAELLWEEARRLYLVRMDGYEREFEACRQKRGGCQQAPKEPRIDLKESERLYKALIDEHPDFRRADLVRYLIGFAAKEDEREQEALDQFRIVIEKHPDSPLFGDAWMMIGEHHFAASKWEEARAAYANVLTRPDAPTYDLALFKTAWCDWKLGDVDTAARRFKEVLDLAVESERAGTAAQRRRRAGLKEEALEYLVVVFTEDRTISAKEVFDFLASIGGEKYSKDVLIKVADSYVSQSEYERANDTYRFLINMDEKSLSAATYQRAIIENLNSALDAKGAQEEIKILLDRFGPQTAWAKQQRNKDALVNSMATTEQLVRVTATNLHNEAQSREKGGKCKVVPPWMETERDRMVEYLDKGKLKKCGPDVLPTFRLAAGAYTQYLDAFGNGKTPAKDAMQIRFQRGQILYFKTGELEAAGDEMMIVGKSAPVDEKLHKPALQTAMDAFELARPKGTQGKNQMFPVDKKFAEAIELYATLFPADKELVGIIFKRGKLFYDYGDFDNAIKMFGVIVTKYPDHPDAGAAGDRILDGLNKGQDFENIESWARKLKKAKAFSSPDQQQRLDRLIIESIGKSGDKYAEAGKFEQAAGFYLRVPKEFPGHPKAPEKMMNAGVMFEKAKQPEKAADVYLTLSEKYPKSPEADKAAFSAGVVYEKVVYYDRAADAFERVVKEFPSSPKRVDALYNAGRLRQALGQHDRAISHYQKYAKEFSGRPDAIAVAFNVGVVYEEAGDHGKAEGAFKNYARNYASSDRRVIEAHARAGRNAYALGQLRRASDEFETALKLYSRSKGKERAEGKAFAAEARYHQGELVVREYEKVSLDVKPKALEKALKKKSELLAKAQKIYDEVIGFEDLKWATASIYRMAQVFDVYAEALAKTPVPKGLSPQEVTAYQDAINLVVIDVQDKAVQLFTAGYQKAIQMQVYDQYTAKIREALGRLAADKFPPEREGRARERFGDRPLGSEMVEEVAR
jgi:TolA-binding protein